MSELNATPQVPRAGGSGGNLLRQLREERGLALEGLAAMLKVTPAKLDALESGRYDELPDAAFTRALAMTVCRLLKADPAPVMASLPQAKMVSLSASEPNEVPFKAKRARLNLDVQSALPWREFLSPRWMVPVGVLLAAAALYFLPQDWMTWPGADEPGASSLSTPAPAASSVLSAEHPSAVPLAAAPASAVAEAASEPVAVPASAAAVAAASTPVNANPYGWGTPVEAPAASGPTALAAQSAGSALVFNVSESSWVEVRDAKGARLLSRHVTPGETVGVDGTPPLAVRIGNASGVSLSYKGQNVDLSSHARNNVARLELK